MIKRQNRSTYRAILLSFSALAAITVAPGAAAQAQGAAQAETSFDFAIPAQPLARTLSAIAERSNIQVVYAEDAPLTMTAPAVQGRMTVTQALASVLAGSGYSYRWLRAGVVTLVKAQAGDDGGERVLGAVRVEGSQGYGLPGATSVNGINGSRDVTATEGTGSYTTGAMTIGSKTAATIKEVPASVSALTNAQMQDQNITGIKAALEQLPGVIAVNNGDSAHPTFYSRGFQITTFQIDGGAGLRTTGGTGNNIGIATGGTYVPQMDMSLYDHVEIIRGAAGTFNGFGDPGGVINLVRKKPLDHAQLLVEGQLGSYELRRASVDLTGPIAFDGKLRGRLIATHQDNDFFYNIIHQDKNIISATLELDVTPATLLSVGVSYDRQEGGMWTGGLMRYADGTALALPRSICLCMPWAHFNTKTIEGFAQLEKKINSQWSLKYKITYQKQIQDNVTALITDPIAPNTQSPEANLYAFAVDHSQPRRWLQELTFDGGFRFLGLNQKIIVGGNISIVDGRGRKSYAINPFQNGSRSVGVNPFSFNPNDPSLSFPGISYLGGESLYDVENLVGGYAKLDLNVLPKLHIMAGANYTHSSFKTKTFTACTPAYVRTGRFGCTVVGSPLPNGAGSLNFTIGGRSNFSWPPSISLRYDFNEELSAYATYADIYVDQSAYITRDEVPLRPITGGNFEGGIKWSPDSGLLNFNISGYYTKQHNFATKDCHDSGLESDPDWVSDGTPQCTNPNGGRGDTSASYSSCCFKDNIDLEKISFGADVDISGRINNNWEIAVSYNFNKNIFRGPDQFGPDGKRNPLLGYSPRNLYKIWTNYKFSDSSNLNGLELNFGAQGNSKTFVTNFYCPQFIDDGCAVDHKLVNFVNPGHILFSLGGSYKINSNIVLQVNIENLLDKTYLAQVGGIGGDNWYGAPRNFAVTLRGKW
jgi:outer-membrane receptor for ferric coprogen and ferric-rhodotorulic acid